MEGIEIIRSRARTPTRLESSGRHPAATTPGLAARAKQLMTTVAASTMVTLERTARSQLLNTGTRHSQWAQVRDALSTAGLVASRDRPAQRQSVMLAADADAGASADPSIPEDAGEAGIATPDPERPAAAEAPAPDHPAAATSVDRAAASGSGTSRIELTIDSLRNYELVKPIPVFVESLGERHYVAEVPDLNITTSASSLSEILIVLKNSITQTYDELRIRKNQDPDQARQLRALEAYIGKSKRSGWLDRR